MKNFLFLLVSHLIIVNNGGLMNTSNNNQLYKTTTKVTNSNKSQYTIYFNTDKTKSLTISESYGIKVRSFCWLCEASFLNKIPLMFHQVNILGKDDCVTKTSWGSTAYYGTELWKKVNGRKFVNLATNIKILNTDMVREYANIELLNIKKYYMSAGIIAKQYVGFSWFYDNKVHRFYFQMFVYFYTKIWGSLIGGRQWLNIGTGIDFI